MATPIATAAATATFTGTLRQLWSTLTTALTMLELFATSGKNVATIAVNKSEEMVKESEFAIKQRLLALEREYADAQAEQPKRLK